MIFLCNIRTHNHLNTINMRKTLNLILMLFLVTTLYAQNDSITYASVKGISLYKGVTVAEIISKLQTKGCTKVLLNSPELSGASILKGSYSGFDSQFTILPCKQNKQLASVVNVKLPERDTWTQLKNDYDYLKSLLSKKYYAFATQEGFNSSIVEKYGTNSIKLDAIKDDEGVFKTEFYPVNNEAGFIYGRIILVISHVTVDYNTTYYVSVLYITPSDVEEQIAELGDV